jgi:RNA polymerase sigma factor for flagellar operon FliA
MTYTRGGAPLDPAAETRQREVRALWRRYRKTGDPAVRDQIVGRYIHIVRYVAGRLAMRLPPHLPLQDLESAGVMGFLGALESFDPEQEVDFATYAQPRIRGAILDELRGQDVLPRSTRQKAKEIERALLALEQQLHRPPGEEEIAAYLGLSLEDYQQLLGRVSGGIFVSLDDTRENGSEEGNPLHQLLREQGTADPMQSLAYKELRDLLGKIIDDLPPQERSVLALYYYEELTMKEIGAVLGISESRVSQVHTAAVLRIRTRLRRLRLGRGDLEADEGFPAGTGLKAAALRAGA